MNMTVICPICGRMTLQNFDVSVYERCFCQVKRVPPQRIIDPTPAHLDALWAIRQEIPK